jgi:hypothetical protein
VGRVREEEMSVRIIAAGVIMTPKQWKIHNVFHADLITPYKETELHSPNFTRPPPDLVDGE